MENGNAGIRHRTHGARRRSPDLGSAKESPRFILTAMPVAQISIGSSLARSRYFEYQTTHPTVS